MVTGPSESLIKVLRDLLLTLKFHDQCDDVRHEVPTNSVDGHCPERYILSTSLKYMLNTLTLRTR